jgi:chaperonin GroES
MKIEDLTPTQDFVILDCIQEDEVSSGGIILPQLSRSTTGKANVVAVGPGKRCLSTGKLLSLDVRIGDLVIYNIRSGQEIEIDGNKYLVVTEHDIFGVIEE